MSIVNADTIRKSDGSLGTDIRIKNTSVYESDGGTSVTQNLVQGLAKAWATNENTSGTFTAHDSFNISGSTDEANGQTTFTINNNMGNANYSIVSSAGASASQRDRTVVVRYDVTATGSYRLDAYDQSTSSEIGMNRLYGAIHGDLA